LGLDLAAAAAAAAAADTAAVMVLLNGNATRSLGDELQITDDEIWQAKVGEVR